MASFSKYEEHIAFQKGWHSISVQRRHIGGEDLEYLNCRADVDEYRDTKLIYDNYTKSDFLAKDVEALMREMPDIPLSEAELNSILRGGKRSQSKLKDHLRTERKQKFDQTGRNRTEIRDKCHKLLQALTRLDNSRQTFDVASGFHQDFEEEVHTTEVRVADAFQKISNSILMTIMQCEKSREEPTTNERGSRFAVFSIETDSSKVSTLFITYNFYSTSAPKILSKERRQAIVADIRREHGKALTSEGIKSITFVKRNTAGLAEEFARTRKKTLPGK